MSGLHIMLDIETLGKAPDGVILQIAAVAIVDKEIVDSFFTHVSTDQQQNRVVDAATVLWWMQQPHAALAATASQKFGCHLPDGLSALQKFVVLQESQTGRLAFIWGNGADFDNAILTHAANQCNKRLWGYRQNRCFRTLKNMCPVIMGEQALDTKHTANGDAEYQAKWLIEIMNHYPTLSW